MIEAARPHAQSIQITSWRCRLCHAVNPPNVLVCGCVKPANEDIGQGYKGPPPSWGRPN